MKCFIYLTITFLNIHHDAVASLDELRPPVVSDQKWQSLKSAVQEAKLLPTPAGFGGQALEFGYSVSLDGDLALIGAPEMAASGAAVIMRFDGQNWSQEAQLIPENGVENERFGSSVSLSGHRALIGSYGDNVSGVASGSASVYEFDGSEWLLVQKLTASDGEQSDSFGYSVALHGSTALIGAYNDDDNGNGSGSAYVFGFNGSSWVESQKLTASDGAAVDYFGKSVTIEGDRALIGATHFGHLVSGFGSAYVFDKVGGVWTESQKLTPGDGQINNQFGHALSLSGHSALISAPGHNELGEDSGAAYVFNFDGSNWAETQKLQASDAYQGDHFGSSVSITGNTLLVGAHLDHNAGSAYLFEFDGSDWQETDHFRSLDSNVHDRFGHSVSLSADRILIGAFQYHEAGVSSGGALVFEHNGTEWAETSQLLAGDGAARDVFGTSVSIFGQRALVGAPADDNGGRNSGSAYIFDFNGNEWINTHKLLTSDHSEQDGFGGAVSLYGNTAMVGADNKNVQGLRKGAVFVFEFDGSSWTETQMLEASDGAFDDKFGNALSVHHDRAMIGAYFDDDNGFASGSVYVFDYDGTSWSETDKLTATDGGAYQNFGKALDLDGQRLIIGAPGDDSTNSNAGAVYEYQLDNQSWTIKQKLTSSDGQANQFFGSSLSLYQNRLLIGATGDDDRGFGAGAAFIFDHDGTTWTETSKLQGLDTASRDRFGTALSLSSNLALVGAPSDSDNGAYSGAAYTFRFNGANWSQEEKLIPVDNSTFDNFGNAVSLSGDLALVGAVWDDDHGTDSGSAYIFDLLTDYEVIVSVTGLATGNSISLNNDDDTLTILENNTQTLSTLHDGSDYDVMITTQPTTPNQLCSFISAASGTLNGADVVIQVQCVTMQYTVSGTATGLAAGNTVVLQNNLADDLIVSDNGGFTFPTPLDDESTYAVSVLTNPDNPNQSCEVTQESGQLAGAPVSDVLINCVTESYTVGGQVTGLEAGNSLTLSLNDGEQYLVVDGNGVFHFSNPLEDLSGYTTSVHTTPDTPSQSCLINNASGIISGGPANDIQVNCEVDRFFIGGFVAGLIADNNLVVQNNGTDQLLVMSEGPFVFGTPLEDEADFAVTIMIQPDDPLQDCELFNDTGTLAGDDVDNIFISCAFGDDLIYRHGFDDPNPINQTTWEPELTQ
ncbi:hypothetical protein ACFODZ_10085 [Marinicella sediminis]|uniref:Uncharacterized protein n=1 Tax=Marinicella sediminis TaxID=1792834 RepID=A0ABV7J8Y0_9GAMM|nr:FG-GAP repeat protein [Marinicella sediminis]